MPDPLWEQYYAWSPYAYAAGNPVSLLDRDGRDAVGIKNENAITVTAVYVVFGSTNESVRNIEQKINNTLNSENYSVNSGEHQGYSVNFDLKFLSANNPEGTFYDYHSFEKKGYPIGNALVFSHQDEDSDLASEVKIMNGQVIRIVKGGTTTNNKLIKMNTFVEDPSSLFMIHELFHTFFFNNDNAESGIGSYKNIEMPNQDDINEMIEGLPIIEE